MDNFLFEWFPNNPILLGIISIMLNIFIAIIGILPSTIVTVSTVGYFGPTLGLIILITGEAIGAIFSFIIYRKGVIRLSRNTRINHIENKYLLFLKKADGINAFFGVILLRIIPFIPSGAVTIAASISKMGLYSFLFSSTLGKIPALFIEAFSVAYLINLGSKWSKQSIFFIALLFIIYLFWKQLMKIKKK